MLRLEALGIDTLTNECRQYLGRPVDDDCCLSAAQKSASDSATLRFKAPHALKLNIIPLHKETELGDFKP